MIGLLSAVLLHFVLDYIFVSSGNGKAGFDDNAFFLTVFIAFALVTAIMLLKGNN